MFGSELLHLQEESALIHSRILDGRLSPRKGRSLGARVAILSKLTIPKVSRTFALRVRQALEVKVATHLDRLPWAQRQTSLINRFELRKLITLLSGPLLESQPLKLLFTIRPILKLILYVSLFDELLFSLDFRLLR